MPDRLFNGSVYLYPVNSASNFRSFKLRDMTGAAYLLNLARCTKYHNNQRVTLQNIELHLLSIVEIRYFNEVHYVKLLTFVTDLKIPLVKVLFVKRALTEILLGGTGSELRVVVMECLQQEKGKYLDNIIFYLILIRFISVWLFSRSYFILHGKTHETPCHFIGSMLNVHSLMVSNTMK